MLKLLTLATLCLAVVTLVTADDYEVQKNPPGYGSKWSAQSVQEASLT